MKYWQQCKSSLGISARVFMSVQRFDLNRLDHSSSRLAQNDLAADRNAVLSYSKY
jgi:hypothetical protein